MKLSDLTQKRRKHIKSCRDNKDKSHEIIASLYSDSSHFIYEILQNADDAYASEVKFSLTLKTLSITHNGKKLFDIGDVESITTVGSSTKKDKVNSIGTFGAGFKSVFAITKTPSIRSRDFHFKITDFIVPEEIEPTNIEENCTHFTLPFDHPNISSDIAYEQIADRLEELESESLLFLRNIKKIQWSTEADSGHYLSEIDGDRASLLSQINGEDDRTKYFLSTKNIKVGGAKLNIVVAYRLNSGGEVTPVHDSKLFVFFPTEVTTGFKFLVHAPYKTTPNRETIPFDDNQNQKITKELSTLIAESIKRLKDSGLLNVNVLSMLPIDSNNRHPLYSSAFEQVKSIFSKESLLPTTEVGGYEKSGRAMLAEEKALTNLLESTDCSRLFDRNTWLNTDITSTSKETRVLKDYLINKLGVPEITMQKFCSKINEEFIKVKPDSWVVDFYSSITNSEALYRVGGRHQTKGVLRERPIIRLEDGRHINPENNSGYVQVYLPPEIGESKFKTVKRTLVENEESKEFLKSLGLTVPDEIAEIKEFIIPEYKGECIDLDKYAKDFEKVLEIWSQSNEYRKKEIIDLLRKAHFVRCAPNNGATSYQLPPEVYFPTEKLSAWFDQNSVDNDVFFLDSSIKLSEQKRTFIESLGVKYELKTPGAGEVRIDSYGLYERSVNGFNPKFDIHGLEYALNNISLERSILLWAVLIKNTNKLRGYIETKTNQNYPYKKREKEEVSKAMTLLNNHRWLYDSEGELINIPIDQITLDGLNDDYNKDYDDIEKLVKVLGLKLDKVAEFEKETGLKAVDSKEHEAFEKWKQDQTTDSDESTDELDWKPEVSPDDATPIEDNTDWLKQKKEDLSGQDTTGGSTDGGQDDDHKQDSNTMRQTSAKNSKEIGDWGEKLAKEYLKKKYPENEVVWLNENGCIGKGYDFVIKENGEDIAYYEVKSKTDESPQLFQVSGTQWNWAKQSHSSEKGDMYKLLVILNAGTEQPKIREINDPVGLWKSGKLYAHPVNIEL